MPEFQDWLRGLALLGQDGSDYVVVKVAGTGELYTLIQGQYAGSPVTVAVDADGNLLAVLKGEYAGSLVTVKLDAEGRLFTYVSDEVDQWGHILPGGLNELAARLGSLQSYERRGQVAFQDAFERGFGEWSSGGSTGYVCELDPVHFIRGGYSAHIQADADADDYVQLLHLYGGVPAGVGVGVSFWARLVELGATIEFGVNVGAPGVLHVGFVRWQSSDLALAVRNAAGGWTDFATWQPAWTGGSYFRFFKVAIDTSTGYYLYAVVDGVQYDLTAYQYYQSTTAYRFFTGGLVLRSSAASQSEAYVDSYVITTRETDEHI